MPSLSLRSRSDVRGAGLGLLVASLLLGSAALPAAGQSAPTPPSTPVPPAEPGADPAPVDEPPGLVPALMEGLDKLEVSSPEFEAAEEDLADASRELFRIREIQKNAARDLRVLGRREDRLTAKVVRATRLVASLERSEARMQGNLRDLAVASYVSGREMGGGQALLELDAHRHNELVGQALMVDTVNADLGVQLRRTQAALEVARTEVTLTTATRAGIRSRIREVRAVQADAGAAEPRAVGTVLLAIADREKWRRLAEVDGTDIPLVVLDSYMKAAQIAALLKPECGIPWWALAGIGRTESHHGSAGGAQVRADGSLTKPILGIPLDGSGETAAIPGKDGGADRAQGPMQFITSTWEKWAIDGNGDGFADVQNTYDAAAAAAGYLCASGPMRTDDDFRRGYFSYNHSGAYVEVVLTRAHEYEAAVEVPPPD